MDFGLWILDFGFWILGFGFWVSDLSGRCEPLKWREPHKSPKFVDLKWLLRRPFPKLPAFARFSGVGSHLAFRILGLEFGLTLILDFGFRIFGPQRAVKMEGTPQKPKFCRFGNACSFSEGHFQGLLVLLDVRVLGAA